MNYPEASLKQAVSGRWIDETVANLLPYGHRSNRFRKLCLSLPWRQTRIPSVRPLSPLVSSAGTRPKMLLNFLLFLGFPPLLVVIVSASQAARDTLQQHRHSSASSKPEKPHDLSYMYEYKKVSAGLIEMWREYEKMDVALRHVLRDYSVAVEHQKYRELVEILAGRQHQAEKTIRKRLEGKGKYHKSTPISHLVAAEMTSLKELKAQLNAEFAQLKTLPTEEDPERLLEKLEFDQTPVDLASALRPDNASLLHLSLEECSKRVHKLVKLQKALRAQIKTLRSNGGKKVHELFISQGAEVGNVFDAEAPLSLHVPLTSYSPGEMEFEL